MRDVEDPIQETVEEKPTYDANGEDNAIIGNGPVVLVTVEIPEASVVPEAPNTRADAKEAGA